MSRQAYLKTLRYKTDTFKNEKVLVCQLQAMERKLFYMWMFISQEGMLEEARDFLCNYVDEPTPFER